MVIALWEQLNKDINNDLKQQILLMILESIINDDNSGLISQIAELTKFFWQKIGIMQAGFLIQLLCLQKMR